MRTNNKNIPLIGIDFGTTKTMVACYDPTRNRADPLRLGYDNYEIPTSIYETPDGQVLFGEKADRESESDYIERIHGFKMKLGLSEPAHVGRKTGTAGELTAEFLSHIRTILMNEELHCRDDGELDHAVITVPNKFYAAQKKDLKSAAETAGFKQVELLAEPVAAGIAFCEHHSIQESSCFLVVDWGGGTFDVALMEKTNEGQIKNMPELDFVDGLDDIGGESMDDLLYKAASDEIERSGFQALGQQGMHLVGRYKREITRAKKRLSDLNEVEMSFTLEDGTRAPVKFGRTKLEETLYNIVLKGAKFADTFLLKCRASGFAPDFVLLVGGTSRMPMVQRVLKDTLNIDCKTWKQGREAIALGAAIHAYQLWGNPPARGIQRLSASLNSGEANSFPGASTGDAITLEAIQIMILEGRHEDAFPIITKMLIERPSDEVFFTWSEAAICISSGEDVLNVAKIVKLRRGVDFWSVACVSSALSGLGRFEQARQEILNMPESPSPTSFFLRSMTPNGCDDRTLNDALRLYPDHPWFLADWTRSLNAKGEHKAAIMTAKKAVRASPFSLSCRFALFMALHSMDDSEMCNHLEVMEKISSETFITKFARLFWMSKMDSDSRKMDELFKKVIDDPRVFSLGNEGISDLHVFRARLRNPECEIDLMIKDLRKAISISPDHELAKMSLEELASFQPSSLNPGYSERIFYCPNRLCGKEMTLTPEEYASKTYACPYCKETGTISPLPDDAQYTLKLRISDTDVDQPTEQSPIKWYFSKSGKTEGPVDTPTLLEKAREGLLQPTDMVWKDGMADWKPASSVLELPIVVNRSTPLSDNKGALPPPTPAAWEPHKKRLTYILLGVFLGMFGAHNWYAGYNGRAFYQIFITGVSCLTASWVSMIWAWIEVATVTKDASGRKLV